MNHATSPEHPGSEPLVAYTRVTYVGDHGETFTKPKGAVTWSDEGRHLHEMTRLRDRVGNPICCFCSKVMTSSDLRSNLPQPETLLGRAFRRLVPRPDELVGRACTRCGWWYVQHSHELPHIMASPDAEWAVGVLHRASVEDYDGPIDGLRDYLFRHPDQLRRLDPLKLEVLVCSALTDHFGDSDVRHVGGSGDGGVDVFVARTRGRPAVVVQVKRRGHPERSEGVEVVRSLHGVMFREGYTRGMVVTTAPRYSRGAVKEASAAARTVRRYRMDLLTRRDIAELLELPPPRRARPWDGLGLPWPTDPYTNIWLPDDKTERDHPAFWNGVSSEEREQAREGRRSSVRGTGEVGTPQ